MSASQDPAVQYKLQQHFKSRQTYLGGSMTWFVRSEKTRMRVFLKQIVERRFGCKRLSSIEMILIAVSVTVECYNIANWHHSSVSRCYQLLKISVLEFNYLVCHGCHF